MKKLPLVLVLSLAFGFIVACGDTKPADSLTEREVICLKVQAMGGTCNNGGGNGGGGTTVTSTSTVTITQTN